MEIQIKNLSFSYKKTDILKGITLNVESGKLCAILGANGAGKSTLIKCINGILKPKKGDVFLDDIDLLTMKQKEKSKLIGYVPQSTQSEDSGLNVFEVVLSGRVPRMKGKMRSNDYDIVTDVLKKMSLEKYSTKLINQLSGGERQRVFIARALVQEPAIMILDEPTNNLDLRFQMETMEIIKSLSVDKGLTVIVAIHDLNTAITYADKVVLLKTGRVYEAGIPRDILNMESIEEIFGVKAAFLPYENKEYMIPKRLEEYN